LRIFLRLFLTTLLIGSPAIKDSPLYRLLFSLSMKKSAFSGLNKRMFILINFQFILDSVLKNVDNAR